MFLVIMAAYACGNVYVFVRALQAVSSALGAHGAGTLAAWACKAAFGVVFWLCASLLFISLFTRDASYPVWMAKGMYLIGSIWMVFTLYMVLSLLVVDITKLLLGLCDNAKSLLPAFNIAKLHLLLSKHGFIYALGFTLILLSYGYVNYRTPRITHIPISFNNAAYNPIPDSLNRTVNNSDSYASDVTSLTDRSIRVVAISDVHLGNGTGKKQLQRYVKLINGLKPDVILIGGDLIDNSVTPLYRENMAEELNMLEAPLGIYMVPGNHEYISGISATEKFIAGTKITLLRDSVVTLPCGVQIIGRDDRHNRSRASLEELLAQIPGTAAITTQSAEADTLSKLPVILLDHQPYELAKADSSGVDLQFYGHTHRGQVWPLNWLTDKIYEQSHGYRKWNNSHVYVSSGLSLWGPPFRIGTHSDIALFTLEQPL